MDITNIIILGLMIFCIIMRLIATIIEFQEIKKLEKEDEEE